ncbi:MAG: 30S ribosomal protein S4 [Patescibacteria group bacterium]|jgi:small subunit ribosomal protein S4|nr:30S ribosomal protein S4 [Patescibacteria group bacterium]
MAKNLDAKCRQCRRAGEKLFLKGERCNTAKCAVVKRNYPPGMHGAKQTRRRLTEYATQLIEKQKAKWTYQILEKQFKITFDRAQKRQGNAGDNLFKLLELRLDNVIYRLGIGSSRGQARQIVSHTHVTVNDKKVNIPSYTVKTGDVIKIKKSSSNNRFFKGVEEKLKNAEIPGWLNLDIKTMEAKVLHEPSREDVNTKLNAQMIVEFYSK